MIRSGKLIRGGDADTKVIQDEGHWGCPRHVFIRDAGTRVMVKRILQDWPLGCPREIHTLDEGSD